MMNPPSTVSRRSLLLLAAAHARASVADNLVYWGTYTAGGPRYGTGESKGIYVSRLNAVTGKLTPPELAAETANPSYVAIHPGGRFLYSVNEHIDPDGKLLGEVSAFSIDRRTGKLAGLGRISSRGGMPCHICTDRTGKMVAVANWATGSAAVFPVLQDGSLGESSGFFQHSGERSGPAAEASAVHCHAVVVSPDNRFLISTDTGLNKIFVNRLDAARGRLAPHHPASLALKNPANPRHLVFHPNTRWAYVANEAGPGCTMLRFESKAGRFEEVSVTSTVPAEFTGRATPAEVVLHPSGKFLFVSNRGHDSIAVLRIDQKNGALTLARAFQPGGSGPRSFNVDPTGRWLFALMQRSNQIFTLRFEESTGELTPVGEAIPLPAPVCAKFLQLA